MDYHSWLEKTFKHSSWVWFLACPQFSCENSAIAFHGKKKFDESAFIHPGVVFSNQFMAYFLLDYLREFILFVVHTTAKVRKEQCSCRLTAVIVQTGIDRLIAFSRIFCPEHNDNDWKQCESGQATNEDVERALQGRFVFIGSVLDDVRILTVVHSAVLEFRWVSSEHF